MAQEQQIAAFTAAWHEIVVSSGAEDPYGRGFAAAMRIALGETAAAAVISQVAASYFTEPPPERSPRAPRRRPLRRDKPAARTREDP
jgi:hypothetical protein